MKEINKIEFEKYKCFKNLSTIEDIKPINIIIGKNNIGKSSILDVIEMMYEPQIKWKNPTTQIYIEKSLSVQEILSQFSESAYGGVIGGNHYQFGKNFIGQNFRFCIKAEKSRYSDDITIKTDYAKDLSKKLPNFDSKYLEHWTRLSKNIDYEILKTKRIYAERNISPEKDDNSMAVSGYGEGITRIISNFLNKSIYKEELVREKH